MSSTITLLYSAHPTSFATLPPGRAKAKRTLTTTQTTCPRSRTLTHNMGGIDMLTSSATHLSAAHMQRSDSGSQSHKKPSTAASHHAWRPVEYDTHRQMNQFFGETPLQRRERYLHVKDASSGKWWFDEHGERVCAYSEARIGSDELCLLAAQNATRTAYCLTPSPLLHPWPGHLPHPAYPPAQEADAAQHLSPHRRRRAGAAP